jgi:hypothetical protein
LYSCEWEKESLRERSEEFGIFKGEKRVIWELCRRERQRGRVESERRGNISKIK